jgi:hypothetical protein
MGVSIFATDGDKPTILYSASDNATSNKTSFSTATITAGQRIEAEIEVVEGGNPEDIRFVQPPIEIHIPAGAVFVRIGIAPPAFTALSDVPTIAQSYRVATTFAAR